jgi:hypothetical protein
MLSPELGRNPRRISFPLYSKQVLQLDRTALATGIRNFVEKIKIDGAVVAALDMRLYVGTFDPW